MRKIIAAVTALFLAVSILGGCGKDTAKDKQSAESGVQDAPKITVGLTYVPNIQFAPLYVAEAKGYFKDAGLEITLRHHGAQEALLGALQAGDEDIVFATGAEMMQGRSTGIDVVNWATMYQNYPVVLIAPKDSGIQKWEDLKGKKIGLPGPYGVNYYSLLAALDIHGLQNDVKMEFIGYTQAAALQEKKVDAVIGFSNNDTVALQNVGIDTVNIPIVEGAKVPLVSAGFGSLANNIHPQAYKKFLDAVEKAVNYAVDNPEETVEITKKYVPSLADQEAADTALAVLEKTLDLYLGDGDFGKLDLEVWDEMEKFLSENKILEKPVKAKETYTTQVLEFE